ncbi:AAA family ATPase [Acrocarpospora catenulata]|uniref:AAA family ATPase n=1 Tax=Acrocarpospora catenulata TaxID=2836182 RepID=UPI001BD9A2AE|nr:AAA family ATPase [Acrocarpospora catenulata]
MTRKVRSIGVEGYTSIRKADVQLGDVTVLIGANGAGKSNFIAAVELLGRIVDRELGLEVGLRGGAQSLLHAGAKGTSSIVLQIQAATNNDLTNGYAAVLVPAADDRLIFEAEQISFQAPKHQHPWTAMLGSGHAESLLHKTQGDAKKVARHVIDILEGCRVFHFQDTSRNAPVKQLGYASGQDRLRPDAGNLAAFLLYLRENHPHHYEQIRRTVQGMAPFFRDFVLAENATGRISLRWSQQNVDAVFPAEALSDGTLRYICLTTLLLQPNPPALLALDEPELGLHPFAIVQLAEMIRSAATRCQVVIATQSVTLLNQFELNDVVIAEREEGATVLRRPDHDHLQEWLDHYSLADLWEKNVLGGRPTPERNIHPR